MRNAKSQLQPNRAFWRLELATGMSREFELRANCLPKLEVLSCSVLAVVTFQLPCMLHTCATFGDLPVARSNHEAVLERTLLSFSSHSFPTRRSSDLKFYCNYVQSFPCIFVGFNIRVVRESLVKIRSEEHTSELQSP